MADSTGQEISNVLEQYFIGTLTVFRVPFMLKAVMCMFFCLSEICVWNELIGVIIHAPCKAEIPFIWILFTCIMFKNAFNIQNDELKPLKVCNRNITPIVIINK
jgi:hypothetical protein